jgi:hypothetical protein
VLFDHTKSGRTIGVEVHHGEAISVWVCDKYGAWVDEGTDAAEIRRDPKAWFTKTLLPKKYSAYVDINFSIECEVEAYDKDEARDLLVEKAYATYQTAQVDGVDATVDEINEG